LARSVNQHSFMFKRTLSEFVWLGRRVVGMLDLRSTVPAAALSSASLDKLFTYMCLCHQAV